MSSALIEPLVKVRIRSSSTDMTETAIDITISEAASPSPMGGVVGESTPHLNGLATDSPPKPKFDLLLSIQDGEKPNSKPTVTGKLKAAKSRSTMAVASPSSFDLANWTSDDIPVKQEAFDFSDEEMKEESITPSKPRSVKKKLTSDEKAAAKKQYREIMTVKSSPPRRSGRKPNTPATAESTAATANSTNGVPAEPASPTAMDASDFFPPPPSSIEPMEFDHVLKSCLDPTLDADLFTNSTTLAPASQRLHITRIQIYKELCEEYFGRYLKDTPDLVEDEVAKESRGIHRHSSRVQKAASKKETPEQLRMIFCEWMNKCEADRVPSSAGRSAKTGLIINAPLPTHLQLKSLSASDASSLQQMMNPDLRPPPTRAEFFESEYYKRLHAKDESPTPVNPNFDLFQYAPFVVTDQYEENLHDLSHELSQSEAEHPTLPAFHRGGVKVKREPVTAPPIASTTLPTPSATVPVATDVLMSPTTHDVSPPGHHRSIAGSSYSTTSSDGSQMDIDSTASLAATSQPEPEEKKQEYAPRTQFNSSSFVSIKLNHSLPSREQAPSEMSMAPFFIDPTPPLSTNSSTTPCDPITADGGVSSNDVTMTDTTAGAAADPSSVVPQLPSPPPRIPVQPSENTHKRKLDQMEEGDARLSSQSPSANSISSMLPAGPNGDDHENDASPVPTLPATNHGVGMFASLDFNSPLCGQWKGHWTNSCFSWRFDNLTRLFSAHAYDSTNRRQNDTSIVLGVIQQGQRQFHRDLAQDEMDETILGDYESKQDRRTRAKKRVKREPGEEEHDEPVEESKVERKENGKSTPFSPSSDEYHALKDRIRSSFESSLSHSLFLPHTYLKDVAPRIHQRAIRMSEECVRDIKTKFALPSDEKEMDQTFGLVVPGFGCEGTQIFLKIGLCVTLLHDEIGWCSALNYMTVRSRGCALWIGLNMHKATVKWSKEKLRQLINATTFNLRDFMTHLKKSGLQPSLQVQTPGTCIYSPSGRGSAHIVITVGSWVEQIAINYSMSPTGLIASMNFWDGVDPLLHNSALATRVVIPLLWLQRVRHWPVGLGEQLQVLAQLEKEVKASPKNYVIHYRDYTSLTDSEVYCDHCFNETSNRRAILLMRIENLCPACFVDRHQEFTHFQPMIDRRFK